MNGKKRRLKHKPTKNKILWGRILVFSILLISLLGAFAYGGFFLWKTYALGLQLSQDKVEQGNNTPQKPTTPKLALEQKSLDKPIYMLLLGKDHNSPAQMDAIFLLSINGEQKMVDIIGIPSNSKIMNRNGEKAEAINELYASGQVNVIRAVVEDIFHIEIPYYAVLTGQDFTSLVDKNGKISLYVEEAMEHYDEGKPSIHLAQGYQELDGDKALQYMRYLDEKNGSLQRMQREERFLKLFLNQKLETAILPRMWEAYQLCANIESNVSATDAAMLMWKLRNLEKDKIQYHILAGSEETIDGKVYWSIDPIEAQRLVGITMTGANTEVLSIEDKGKDSKKDKATKHDDKQKKEGI